jgi:hypothetical protein
MSPQRYLITTLAEYQTVFWSRVGLELKRLGHDVAFISFDDRSTEMLRTEGFRVFSLSEEPSPGDVSYAAMEEVVRYYGLFDLNLWFSHERFAFGLRDSSVLRRKLLHALSLTRKACTHWAPAGNAVLVQELGGFLSVIGSYFAARKHGLDNWFIEPAFFRGRLFFLRNSFAAMSFTGELPGAVSTEVSEYLEKTSLAGTIVVPQKDRHHYSPALRKVLNWKNFKRLIVKLADKYMFGKRQEFGYLGRHVRVHLRMLRNSQRLSRYYAPAEKLGHFVYYPLHVPADMALTLRSPQFLDQLALIDFLARSVPHTHHIAIKEHPAMIGAIDAHRLIELLERYDNLFLISPSLNNYQILRACDAVVSVNSKSGAEALSLGKPVLVLGDAFYADAPFVDRLKSITELPGRLSTALRESRQADPDVVKRYFEGVWQRSLPGELYITDFSNVTQFTASMVRATSSVPDVDQPAED